MPRFLPLHLGAGGALQVRLHSNPEPVNADSLNPIAYRYP